MLEGFLTCVQALSRIASINPMAIALTKSPKFVDKSIPAQDIETMSTLGPYFRLSPLQVFIVTFLVLSPKLSGSA